jgi:VanZ family protein
MGFSRWMRLLLRVLWCVALAIVIVGSVLPSSSGPVRWMDRLNISDKVLHAAGYALLALLPALHERRRAVAVLCFGLIGLGIAIEAAQYLLHNGRLFEVRDLAANTAGVLGGVMVGLVARNS